MTTEAIVDEAAPDDAARRLRDHAHPEGEGDERRDRHQGFLEEMNPDERERLVRIGLHIVLGPDADRILVHRKGDIVYVGEVGHRFGFPPDPVLGANPRTVLEHDLEWLADELCETSVAWSKRLPECPLHPDSHPLTVVVLAATVTASCPTTGRQIRSRSF